MSGNMVDMQYPMAEIRREKKKRKKKQKKKKKPQGKN